MFASAWLPVCMSAHVHGFCVHLAVRYQCWGREEGIVGLGCVYFQKTLGSRSCDLSVGKDDFLGNSEVRTRAGTASALHSKATHVGLFSASLAASRALQAVPVARLLLAHAGYSFLLTVG